MTGRSTRASELVCLALETLDRLDRKELTLHAKLELDRAGEFPTELIRFMLSPEIALHLVFIPEQYGGLGAGAQDVASVSEKLASMDLAVATSFLAICLGIDPIRVGATKAQKEQWLRRVAEEGLIVAYAVTEPEAGSNVQALKTRADRVLDAEGRVQGYRLNGQKQFITNGGVASLYTLLAATPEGPSFFIVEAGVDGLCSGQPEDKHGIRASNTCSLTLDDVYLPVDRLLGGQEGQGLVQANQVFGYTRLMVATLGLGGGTSALNKAVAYAKERVQFGTPLSNKQGFTHQLLVPSVVHLEAARAHIEAIAARLDSGEQDLQVEGSISKYFATEAGDRAANNAIQALGGYGYIRDFEVEKIKRDIKITTIFEGTSEIQKIIIAAYRLRETVASSGRFYLERAESLECLSDESGAKLLAQAMRVLNRAIQSVKDNKLSRRQYIMFLLADMVTWCEVGEALCLKASDLCDNTRSPELLKAAARIFARQAAVKVYLNGFEIAVGYDRQSDELNSMLESLNMRAIKASVLADMDCVAAEVFK